MILEVEGYQNYEDSSRWKLPEGRVYQKVEDTRRWRIPEMQNIHLSLFDSYPINKLGRTPCLCTHQFILIHLNIEKFWNVSDHFTIIF